MYSIVLAAALASNPAVPACHGAYGWGGYGGYGCYGYYGGYGRYGYRGYDCYYGGWSAMPVAAPTMQAAAATPAQLVVRLPADAKLFVDDQPTSSRSTQRTFVTPNLDPGYVYSYTVRAEIVRDGQKHIETKKVNVSAGGVSQLSFTESAMTRANGGESVASARR